MQQARNKINLELLEILRHLVFWAQEFYFLFLCSFRTF